MTLSKVLFGAAVSVAALGGIAFADEPSGDTSTTAGDASGAPADPTATTPATTVGATGEQAPAAWPGAIIDRPLTLNAGMVAAGGQAALYHSTGDVETLGISGAYGVTNELTVGANYEMAVHEFEAKGPLNVLAAYRLANGKLKAAATVGFSYNFSSETGDLGLGAAVQYNVAPTFAVYTGGNQIGVGIKSPNPITLALPVGVALQATPQVYAFAQTQLASFSIKDSANVYISDITPVQVGAFFSPSNTLDIGLAVNFLDVQHAGDAFGVMAAARFFKI
jgi:hypothetical protein